MWRSRARTRARPLVARIGDVRAWLTGLDEDDLTDRGRVRVLTALEELAGALGGAQVRMTAAYASSQRSLGCSARGVAAEVGLARRTGLARASRLVSAARTLVDDLPETLEHLESGRLSEERAMVVAAQVAHLDAAERLEVDELIAADLPRLGDAEVRDAVDAAATMVDPAAVEARRRAACRQRRVTVRPAHDGMAWLSIHTTAVEAAAAQNTLHAHADSVLAGTGGLSELPEDPEGRSHSEIMADAALSRLTGRTLHEGPPVEVCLVMTDTALAGDDAGPGGTRTGEVVARAVGVGPMLAGVARELIRRTSSDADSAASERAPRTSGADGHPGNGERPGTNAWPMFEGPDWAFDDRTAVQRARDASADLVRWARDERESSRVTVRRVHLGTGGRDAVAIDARRRLMPLAVRAAIDGGGRQQGSVRIGTTGRDPDVASWFARLRAPARPDELADLTSGGRCGRGILRLLVVLRDQRCRVPWCTAPIRHLDHVTPHRDGGLTSFAGLAGTCAGHNIAKEDPGHRVIVTHDGTHSTHPHTLRWTTPSGLAHDGEAPPILGWGTDAHLDELTHDEPSPLEVHLEHLLVA